MKRLILLRHAKSDWSDHFLADHDRPLNKRGQNAATQLGRYFRQQNLRPDLVLCSTAERTRETLTILQKSAEAFFPTTHRNRLYGARAECVLSLLHEQKNPDLNTLMIVGHNPCIEQLALELTGIDESALLQDIRKKVPTGSLIILDFNIESFAHISLNSGKLVSFIRPKHELIEANNSKSTNL